MPKRTLTLLAALVIAVALAGCSTVKPTPVAHKTHIPAPIVHVNVPVVVGETEAQANAALRSKHLYPEPDSSQLPATAGNVPTAGLVVTAEKPAAGTTVDAGDVVDITLGLGKVTVPDLSTDQCSDAVAAVTSAGLTTTATCSPDEPVKAQSPAAGTVVAALSSVTISAPPPMIVYTITGNGRSSNVITWTVPGSFDIEQASDAALPWSMSFPEPTDGDSVENISAQDEYGSSISCSITDNGTVIDSETATGQYAIVQCSS